MARAASVPAWEAKATMVKSMQHTACRILGGPKAVHPSPNEKDMHGDD
eukprot:CAMPEP_0171273576 /NCGR_PEP_ID=MMETSP0790-20130122/62361_1 /TAXON_ID=2925 /ORGANISM="Alexandrium catenella, Strain OF101" /LENGTH=47 /DNA_ID= /DNA_START= /DNA_END= /DNA_ORIENTATION=